MDFRTILKKISIAIAIFLICLFFIVFRFFLTARAEYKTAQKDLQAGRIENAITHYDTAIRNYFPFSPYVKNSTANLIKVAETYENQGKYKDAFNIWQTLLSAYSAINNPLFFPPVSEKEISGKMDSLKNKILENAGN